MAKMSKGAAMGAKANPFARTKPGKAVPMPPPNMGGEPKAPKPGKKANPFAKMR